MVALALHSFHARRHARFAEVNGVEMVDHYGESARELAALHDAAGVLDLSSRGRLLLTGADRQSWLNGQVTNNVKNLQPGEGCYAVMLTAQGRMHCDANIYCLPDELLLDLEPGWSDALARRWDRFIVADDVRITAAGERYGLLSAQGPAAAAVIERLGFMPFLPAKPLSFTSVTDAAGGGLYCVNNPRVGSAGFDLFVPAAALEPAAEKLWVAAEEQGGRACGWQALEGARIEAGLPRFGADMDETTLPPECGLEEKAVSQTKGCYLGQEVMARLRTRGTVAKKLCGLRLENELKFTPKTADKLYWGETEIGYVTSFFTSPTLNANIALGYVRREHHQIGTELRLRAADGACTAWVVQLPFK